MCDIELAAQEGVGDFTEAAKIEAETELVEVGLAAVVVVTIARQLDDFPLLGIVDTERTGAGAEEAIALGVASVFQGHDAADMHGQQREEEGRGLIEMN